MNDFDSFEMKTGVFMKTGFIYFQVSTNVDPSSKLISFDISFN